MTLGAAYAAYIISNLIHNDFGLDPAVVPATALGALYYWRGARPLLWATALVITLPAFSFLKPEALLAPERFGPFANHWALLAAGCLAAISAILATLKPSPVQSE